MIVDILIALVILGAVFGTHQFFWWRTVRRYERNGWPWR